MNKRIISIVGNAKNAGKTTVLNALVKGSQAHFLLTSIGLDGEDLDQVTHLEKPQVFVRKNDYVLSARDTLEAFSAPYKIIKTYPIQTSIGEIVLCQILGPGKVLIAGPSKVEQMRETIMDIQNNLDIKVIVDGAFFRQSFAHIGDGVIFVVGANFARDMATTIEHAALNYWKLTLEKYTDDCFIDLLKDQVMIIKNKQVLDLGLISVLGHSEEILRAAIDIDALYIPKALTDEFVDCWTSRYAHQSFNLILQSGIHIQLNDQNLMRLKHLAKTIYVKQPINVLAVCMNPTSPSGYTYPKDVFKKALERNLKLRVYDVKEDDIYE